MTRGEHYRVLIHAVFLAVRLIGPHAQSAPAVFGGVRISGIFIEILAVAGHGYPGGEVVKAVRYQQVIDIAHNARAVAGKGMNTAASLAFDADVAGILRIHVLADYVAVVVKGVDGLYDIVCRFALVLLLGGLNHGHAGGGGVGVGRFIAHNELAVFHAVLGDAGDLVSGKGVCNAVHRVAGGVEQFYRRGHVFVVLDNSLPSVGVCHGAESAAGICIQYLGIIRSGNRRQQIAAVSKPKVSAGTVGNGGDPAGGVGDIHMVARRVGDFDQSAGGVKLIGIVALLEGASFGVIAYIRVVYVHIQIVAVGAGVAACNQVALFEAGLLPVLVRIHVAVIRFAFVLKRRGHHALHDIKLEAVAHIHRGEIGDIKLDAALCGILIYTQGAVVQVLYRNRHAVARPGEVLGLEHKVAALEVDAALAEAAELMGVRAVGGVYAVARLIGDDKLRHIIPAVRAAVELNTVAAFGCFV